MLPRNPVHSRRVPKRLARSGAAGAASLIASCCPMTNAFSHHVQGLNKEQKDELAAAEKAHAWLTEGNDIRFGDWTAAEVEWLNSVQVGVLVGAGHLLACWTECAGC